MNKGIKSIDNFRQRRRIVSQVCSSSEGYYTEPDQTIEIPIKRRGRGRPPKQVRKNVGRKPVANPKATAKNKAADDFEGLGFVELPKKRGRPRKPGSEKVKTEDVEEGLYDLVGKKRRKLGKITDQSTQTILTMAEISKLLKE